MENWTVNLHLKRASGERRGGEKVSIKLMIYGYGYNHRWTWTLGTDEGAGENYVGGRNEGGGFILLSFLLVLIFHHFISSCLLFVLEIGSSGLSVRRIASVAAPSSPSPPIASVRILLLRANRDRH